MCRANYQRLLSTVQPVFLNREWRYFLEWSISLREQGDVEPRIERLFRFLASTIRGELPRRDFDVDFIPSIDLPRSRRVDQRAKKFVKPLLGGVPPLP